MADAARRQAPQFPATSWLRPLPAATRLILHGGPKARTLAAAAWGVGFAEESCRALFAGKRATLWMGPDEYLLIDADPSALPVMEALTQALAPVAHALVDISHRQIGFEIKGQHAEPILAGGCPLDLDIGSFPLGMCTRTICGKADIVLWRTAGDTFHVEVWRSFSDYFVALLTEIARDIVA
jgi:sarcosine oxidase, subunit gamma